MRASRCKPSDLATFVANNEPSIQAKGGLEAWHKYLQSRTGLSGPIYTLEVKYLRDNGALGGTLHDLWGSYLSSNGYPANNDGLRSFLRTGSFTITLQTVLSALPWYAFYSAQDTAASYSVGTNTIATMRDMMGNTNRNLVQASGTARPNYVASDAQLGTPAFTFDGTDDRVTQTGANFGTLSQPDTVTAVFAGSGTSGSKAMFDSFDAGFAHQINHRDSNGKTAMYAGTLIEVMDAVTTPTYMACSFDGSRSHMFGNANIIGLDPAGSGTLNGFVVGRERTGVSFFAGSLAHVGVINSKAHQLDGWATYERWIRQNYPASCDPIKYSAGGAQKVVIMGDSILDQPQTQIETELADKALLFNAMGGTQALDWTARARVVGDTTPDVLVLSIGTNDLNTYGVTQTVLQNRYMDIINRARARKTICFTLYTGPGSVQPTAFATFNTWLTNFVASRTDCVIYDWNTISQANGWAADGWGHPTDPAGRQGLADGIEALIEA